jgi:L-alanine-DL-glutamate epimerase-like enolase superfamily enzyme
MKDSDIRIREIRTFKAPAACRTPLKFGAVVVEDIPIGYARAVVESRAGEVAVGWGAMFLMDLWAWPTAQAPRAATTRLMCELLDAYAELVQGRSEFAHPIEIFMDSERDLRRLGRENSARLTPGEEIPFLGSLVAVSPIDHAVHDAFGNVNGIDCYRGYGPEHMSFDLSRHLGRAYQGVYPSQFLRQDYLRAIPVFHLVGGVDLLRTSEVGDEMPDDGLPNSLDEWIRRDGVFCLKVKLRGNDMTWDVDRTLAVSQIYHEIGGGGGSDLPERPFLTADFNEQCESPDYVVEYLNRVREREARVFDELLYIEQPTERDLEAHQWDMRPLASLKPVLIDESLASADDFDRAVELGWSGIALKSCKCLSSDLLLLCAAELAGIPYAIQDLTNPSIALVESVGFAARTHTIKGVEANSRQFFPRANDLIAQVHPDLCGIRDGFARTGSIRGTGLGMQMDRMPGFAEAVESADAEFRAG